MTSSSLIKIQYCKSRRPLISNVMCGNILSYSCFKHSVNVYFLYTSTEWGIIMKATVVDLRYKMNDVLKALDRNEKVTVFYRGKVKGVLVPSGKQKKDAKMAEHPFFGMSSSKSDQSVLDELDSLRNGRFNDI
jgi:hypothetical protein